MKALAIQNFNYYGKQLRVLVISDKDWYYANDVCNLLGYEKKDIKKFLDRFVSPSDIKVLPYKASDKLSGAKKFSFWGHNDYTNKKLLDEYGVNDLIIHSRAKDARKIQHWITHKVIPSIVHKGGYIYNSAQFFGSMNNNQIELLKHALNQIEARNNQNKALKQHNHALAKKKKQMTPTYDYGRGMSANMDHTFTTKEAAHIFSQRFNIVNCGTVNFNRLLRSTPMSILSNQKGKNHNLPRKYYLHHKWCVVHYTHIVSPYQHKKIACRTVYFTAKGVKGVLDKFKQNRIFVPYSDWNPAVLDTKWLDKNYIYKNKHYLEHCGGHRNINKIHYVQDVL